MTRVVVADSGPLIALARLELLSLLGQLFDEVQVPHAVFAECVARPDLADARHIQAAADAGAFQLCDAQPVDAPGLDAGESHAIGRALEIGAALLADDRAARRYARERQLVVIGTLGVLVRAKRQSLLPAVRPLIERLRASGHHLSEAATVEALGAANE